MAVIHISEKEAARDLPAVLAKVRAGNLVEIDSGSESFAVVAKGDAIPPRRSLDEAIRMSEERGSRVLLDDDFGDDMEEIMRLNRLPRETEPWESS
jgi:hypothetical protein